MESASVKKKVMLYVSDHKDENMDEIYGHIEDVDFDIDLGKNRRKKKSTIQK